MIQKICFWVRDRGHHHQTQVNVSDGRTEGRKENPAYIIELPLLILCHKTDNFCDGNQSQKSLFTAASERLVYLIFLYNAKRNCF